MKLLIPQLNIDCDTSKMNKYEIRAVMSKIKARLQLAPDAKAIANISGNIREEAAIGSMVGLLEQILIRLEPLIK